MRRALRRFRDRVIRALHGAPSSVIPAYRDALEQAGVGTRVVEAYGDRGLARLAPFEHRRLLASGRSDLFAHTPRPQIERSRSAKPKMLFHFGAQKTGTTATQLAMHRDRARLWERGVLYPSPVAFFGTRNYDSHNGLLSPLTRRAASSDPNLTAFRRYFTELASGAELTVLSSERFYGAVDGLDVLIAPQEWGQSYWTRRRRLLAKLAEYLSAFDVTPVLWLRSPDTFADSFYRETLKANLPRSKPSHRRYRGSFAEFRAAAAPLWDYDKQVAAIEEVFGNVAVHRFEDGEVVATMYSHLGVAPPARAGESRANSRADARVALWLNGTDLGGTRQRQAFGWSENAANALQEGSDGSLWESEAARESFVAGLSSTRFGTDYFPPLRPLQHPAQLTEGDAKRLTAAFKAWSDTHPEAEFLHVDVADDSPAAGA